MPAGLTLPDWFLRVVAWAATAFVLLFVPWATWMSKQVIDMHVHMDAIPAIVQRVTLIESAVSIQGRQIKRLERIRVIRPDWSLVP